LAAPAPTWNTIDGDHSQEAPNDRR